MEKWKPITNVKHIGHTGCKMVETSEFPDSEIYADNEEDRAILESAFYGDLRELQRFGIGVER